MDHQSTLFAPGIGGTVRGSRSRIMSFSNFIDRGKKSGRLLFGGSSRDSSQVDLNNSGTHSKEQTSANATKLSPNSQLPTLVTSIRATVVGNSSSQDQPNRKPLLNHNFENKATTTKGGPNKFHMKPLTKKIEAKMKEFVLDDEYADDEEVEKIQTIGPSKFIERKSKPTTRESIEIADATTPDSNNSKDFQQNFIGRRVVQLSNLSPFVGIKSIIAQITGGPLEKIVILSNSLAINNNRFTGAPNRNPSLELWFVKPDDAESFMRFSLSGMFLINGFHYQPQWAPPHSLLRSQEPYHIPLKPFILEEVEQTGARRCLILKKRAGSSAGRSSRHYPSPKSHLSELSIPIIHQDFHEFGEILEITPVISRKLCVAIHYFHIEGAIRAKKCFEDRNSEFYQKYSQWSLWYGKDPVDKPCINI